MKTSAKERSILRALAARKAELALHPDNIERREAWYAHDAGCDGRPMVLAEFEGVRDSNPPLPESVLECESEWARGIEKALKTELYRFDILRDDHVIERFFNVRWHVTFGNYGVDPRQESPQADGTMGASRWEPAITDIERDMDKLHFRERGVDRLHTLREKEALQNLFGGILEVRIRGDYYWTMGMTIDAIPLIGLENLMLKMYDDPQGLHRLMAFLRDDRIAVAEWLEAEGLYSLNNDNDYIGSGSMGYTRELPATGAAGADAVRTADLWVLLESQETVGVSPELYEEFIFPYEKSIAERFGKVYYGCCEPVHGRWDVVKRMPNLARVSVSPWADQRAMAEALGADLVFSRKPHPALVSTGVFDPEAVRRDIRDTLDAARGCRIEFIMKDVHTLHNEPDRLARWVALVREEMQ